MKNIFYLLAISLLSHGCSSPKSKESMAISPIVTNQNAEIINIDDGIYKEKISFAEIFSAPQTILLETKDECLIKDIQSMEVFNRHIYILDDEENRLYVFDLKGHFLYQIGSAGGGPGEYIRISDFTIDRTNSIIYILDESADKIHKYNLKNKEYISSIKVKKNGRQHFYLQYINHKLYVNETAIDEQSPKHLLKCIDPETGELKNFFLDSKEYNRGWNLPLRNYHNFFFGKGTDSPKYIEWFMNTIVCLENGEITPAYIVKSNDFATNDDVSTLIEAYRKKNLYNFESITSSGKIYHIENFVESDKFIHFRYEKSGIRYSLLYDKGTKTSIFTDNFTNDYFAKDFCMNQTFCYYDKCGAYGVVPTELLPIIKKHVIETGILNPEIDQYDNIRNIKEEANPVIFSYPFK